MTFAGTLHVLALTAFASCFTRLVGGGALTSLTASLVGAYLFLFVSFAVPACLQVLDPVSVAGTGVVLAIASAWVCLGRRAEGRADRSSEPAEGPADVWIAFGFAAVWFGSLWRAALGDLASGQQDIDVVAYHAPALVEFVQNRGYLGDSPQVNTYFYGYESIAGSLAIFPRSGLFFNLLFLPNLLLLACANALLLARARLAFGVGRRNWGFALFPLAAFWPFGGVDALTVITKNDLAAIGLLAAGVAALAGLRREGTAANRGPLLLGGAALCLAASIKPTYAVLALLFGSVACLWPLRGDGRPAVLHRRLAAWAAVSVPVLLSTALWLGRNLANEGVLFSEAVRVEGGRYVILNCYRALFANAARWHRYFGWHLWLSVGVLASAFCAFRPWRLWAKGSGRPTFEAPGAQALFQQWSLMALGAGVLSLWTPFCVYHVAPPDAAGEFCFFQARLVQFHFQFGVLALMALALWAVRAEDAWAGRGGFAVPVPPRRALRSPTGAAAFAAPLGVGLSAFAALLWAGHWEGTVRYRTPATLVHEFRYRLPQSVALYRWFLDMEPGKRIVVANMFPYPLYGRGWRHEVVNSPWFPIEDFRENEKAFAQLLERSRADYFVVGYWENERHRRPEEQPRSFVAWATRQGYRPELATAEVVVFSTAGARRPG